jgi:hypothetical protein
MDRSIAPIRSFGQLSVRLVPTDSNAKVITINYLIAGKLLATQTSDDPARRTMFEQ